MGGSYERKDTTSAAPPCGDDLVTYPIGLCEAYFGRYAERLDDAQVRVETRVIAVLHTYGETKQLHVHTHMIMSWGGIDNGNKIVVPEHDYVHIPLSARCSVTSLKMR